VRPKRGVQKNSVLWNDSKLQVTFRVMWESKRRLELHSNQLKMVILSITWQELGSHHSRFHRLSFRPLFVKQKPRAFQSHWIIIINPSSEISISIKSFEHIRSVVEIGVTRVQKTEVAPKLAISVVVASPSLVIV
jgi:hypothetical protein